MFANQRKMVVILHFGEALLSQFKMIIAETGIAGLDAQFVNNSLRRPLYILCTQNPISFSTVPGFLMLLAKNDAAHERNNGIKMHPRVSGAKWC